MTTAEGGRCVIDVSKALAYLAGDSLHHMDMLESLRRGTGEILAAEPDGVLLKERACNGYFLSARTQKSAHMLLSRMDEARLMAVHQDFCVEEAARRFGLTPTMRCHQAAWLIQAPPDLPQIPFEIRPLPPGMAKEVQRLYSHDIGLGYIQGRLSAGEMFGAFRGGELAGFIGRHEEGSIGMLEVLPGHRRMGVGTLLVAYLCRRLMGAGLTPFSQFSVDNAQSRALHEKMGFSISTRLIYWLEPPKG